jgi:pyrimidine-nucleoside phosphorylase
VRTSSRRDLGNNGASNTLQRYGQGRAQFVLHIRGMSEHIPVKELLRRKRDGGTWTDSEISWFVKGVASGKVSDAQCAAFLMAACIRDLTVEETTALTLSMMESGNRLSRGTSVRAAVDKHSTGGVGDKVSLLLSPLAIACGLAVPMISGRGLGHTGGTVDKLESVHGLRMDVSMTECEKLLRENHGFMSAATDEIAPADKRLYALRDTTGTVENVGLITASILSKKMCEGLDGLVMDVKVGRGAFMHTMAEARRLGSSIAAVSHAAGLRCTVVYTAMDVPLGRAVGNWLEMVEAEQSLASYEQADPRLRTVTEQLVAEMLLLAGSTGDVSSALALVEHAWTSGAAHAEFHNIISRQGGDWRGTEREAQQKMIHCDVCVETAGVLVVDARALALAVMKAGGGRLRDGDAIDPYVGVNFVRQTGEVVNAGETVATVTATMPDVLSALASDVARGMTTIAGPVTVESVLEIRRE